MENNFWTSQKGNIQSVMMRNFESNFNALIFRIPIPSQSSYAFFHFENMCGFCSLYHHLGFYCMYYWTYYFHDEKSGILKLGSLLNCTEKSLQKVSYDFVLGLVYNINSMIFRWKIDHLSNYSATRAVYYYWIILCSIWYLTEVLP